MRCHRARRRASKCFCQYTDGNVIVYARHDQQSKKTVDFLEDQAIPAAPYHGKMDSTSRRRQPERWMSDEVRVSVGTIAFGLGITKRL